VFFYILTNLFEKKILFIDLLRKEKKILMIIIKKNGLAFLLECSNRIKVTIQCYGVLASMIH